nr:hypothetical protein [Tanacetum cinerariifolium]
MLQMRLSIRSWVTIWCQETIGDTIAQTRFYSVSKHSNDLLLARARVESSDNEESLGEDASKQERRIDAINADDEITLVNDVDNEMFDVDDLGGEEVFVVEQDVVSNAATTETITTEEITLAQALKALKTSKPKAKGIVFQKPEKRRKHFATKRAEEKRNKPPTQAQKRKIMCTYLKNMKGYKLKELEQEITKKQKVDDDKEKAELKQLMEIIPNEEEVAIDAIPLAVKDLPEADMKEILHQRIWETNSYKTHKDHMMLYEALEKSINCDHTEELLKDMDEACKKNKKSRDSPNTPLRSPPHQPHPPSPPAGPSGTARSPGASGSSQVLLPPFLPLSTNQEGQSHGSIALSSSKTAASAEYKAWTTTDTRLRLSVSSTPKDLQMDDDMAPDAQAHSSDDEDIRNAHIPMVNLRQDWWKPLEEDRHATPEPAYVDDSIIRHNVSKPLPLGDPPGQVTIQSDFFFNKDLEYLRYGSKGSRPALSISKMKAAYYPDVGLEQMVPDQIWID